MATQEERDVYSCFGARARLAVPPFSRSWARTAMSSDRKPRDSGGAAALSSRFKREGGGHQGFGLDDVG